MTLLEIVICGFVFLVIGGFLIAILPSLIKIVGILILIGVIFFLIYAMSQIYIPLDTDITLLAMQSIKL